MSKTSAILGETHQDCQSEINVCGHRSNLYLRGPARKITLSMVSVNRIAFPCINGEPSSIVWQYDIIWNKINLLQANLCPALSVDGRAGTVFSRKNQPFKSLWFACWVSRNPPGKAFGSELGWD